MSRVIYNCWSYWLEITSVYYILTNPGNRILSLKIIDVYLRVFKFVKESIAIIFSALHVRVAMSQTGLAAVLLSLAILVLRKYTNSLHSNIIRDIIYYNYSSKAESFLVIVVS